MAVQIQHELACECGAPVRYDKMRNVLIGHKCTAWKHDRKLVRRVSAVIDPPKDGGIQFHRVELMLFSDGAVRWTAKKEEPSGEAE